MCSRTMGLERASFGSQPVRVTMADGLNKVRFLKWFAGGSASLVSGYSVMTIVIALTVVYLVSSVYVR